MLNCKHLSPRPHRAVGNGSDYRSRVHEFNPAWSNTFVEIDHEIISTYGHSPPSTGVRRVVVSYEQKYVHEVLVNCLVKHISWARLASFCHLGFISDPLIVSKFQNETQDPKGQENKIYTIVKGRETFYRRHTVPVTSCSEVKYVLKRVSFGSKDCTKDLKLECAYFLGQAS